MVGQQVTDVADGEEETAKPVLDLVQELEGILVLDKGWDEVIILLVPRTPSVFLVPISRTEGRHDDNSSVRVLAMTLVPKGE